MEENERIRQEEEEEVEQEIWSWGAGTEGQLATGKLQDEHQPQLVHSLSSFGLISFLSCGGAHVIALAPGGKVLTWGRGTSGQLGHGEMVNSLQPKLVESLQSLVITHVSAGWNHSGFVSETGCSFTCGDGSFGQLGHGDFASQCSPTQVSYFNSSHVSQIACGMRHSLALLKDHQVFGFGSGKRGQLGISDDKVRSVSLPRPTLGLKDIKITSVNANGDHSAALCAAGRLYTWGRGFGGASDMYCPQYIKTSLLLSQVALGWNHALALTCDGKTYMLGGYLRGALCDHQRTPLMSQDSQDKISTAEEEEVMQDIPGLENFKVVQIAAGAEHSAIVTEIGSVMCWGWGEHGQLGLGDTVDQTLPQLVQLSPRMRQTQIASGVYCGSGFTYTIKTN